MDHAGRTVHLVIQFYLLSIKEISGKYIPMNATGHKTEELSEDQEVCQKAAKMPIKLIWRIVGSLMKVHYLKWAYAMAQIVNSIWF